MILHTAFCLLPTAYCLLPTGLCLLLTAYCLLLTAHCSLLTNLDYHFSPGMLFFHVTHSFINFSQSETPVVDYRSYLSCLNELSQNPQVLLIRFGQKADELLAHER